MINANKQIQITMKKLNVKKYNQFMMSGSNSAELKSLVSLAATNMMSGETPVPVQIQLLVDLGLLADA